MKTKQNLTTKIAASLALFAILISIVGTMILYFSSSNAQVQVEPNPNEMSNEELLERLKNSGIDVENIEVNTTETSSENNNANESTDIEVNTAETSNENNTSNESTEIEVDEDNIKEETSIQKVEPQENNQNQNNLEEGIETPAS